MRLRWSGRAFANFATAVDEIASASPSGARRIANRIEEAISHLRQHPEMARAGEEPGTRELVVSGTNYIVVYRVSGREIIILSVLDGRRQRPND